MTPTGLISIPLALRRGLPAASTHYYLTQVKPWTHTSASSPNYLSTIEQRQAKKGGHRLTHCLAAPSL